MKNCLGSTAILQRSKFFTEQLFLSLGGEKDMVYSLVKAKDKKLFKSKYAL